MDKPIPSTGLKNKCPFILPRLYNVCARAPGTPSLDVLTMTSGRVCLNYGLTLQNAARIHVPRDPCIMGRAHGGLLKVRPKNY